MDTKVKHHYKIWHTVNATILCIHYAINTSTVLDENKLIINLKINILLWNFK